MIIRSMLYGLHVASEVPLYQDRPVGGRVEPDVEIRQGESMQRRNDQPPGRVLAHLETDQPYYTFTVTGDGDYILRFYGTCDFVVDTELRSATVHVVDGADAGLAGVLAAGALLSFVLTMREHPVLHASAIQVGDGALAFVGRSGMGKSTMAALMCAAGGRLITDDVLRVDLEDGAARCRLGATELRLRKAAAELAESFPQRPSSRETSDSRDALRMVESNDDGQPLRAVVVPVPDHERTGVEVERMAAMDALIALLQFPRLVGWTDPAVLDRQFRDLGDLVERVAVYVAHVPWGPPFSPAIAPSILTATGMEAAMVSLPLVGGTSTQRVPVTNADVEASLAADDADRFGNPDR